MADDETEYSDEYAGDERNYGLAVRFDQSDDGYVGISQNQMSGRQSMDRVLLSPAQVRALLAFVRPVSLRKRSSKATRV